MISAQNLVYSLQGRRLTDNVSLTFPGGEIVAIGTPEQVAKNPKSFTGQYLAPLLAKDKSDKKAVDAEKKKKTEK